MKELSNKQRYGTKTNKKEKFNEELLYELYKEYPFDNAKEIREFMLRKHGVYASSNLVASIINYQIRKYGERKSSGNKLIRIYERRFKTGHRREKERERRKDEKKNKNIETTLERCYYESKKSNK